MSDIAIRVENLSKLYRIGQRERYKALRDTLTDAMYAPFRALAAPIRRFRNPQSAIRNPQSNNTIWALKDVSFEVKHGEVVGFIGRNGAGKSTLLKILSRITEPTEGYAEIHGRVGSLLEVGTGFHPELTGRENIYLNGAIMGMKKAEIERKFDEIVAFAEIEKFLDTPVKRYSSGMYVRLAFAVAAHLEPEILLVDEVLAVGDAQFQKKCLGKMGDVAKEGRTVLFVSHNMGMITSLCQRAILLDSGRIAVTGTVSDTVSRYYTNGINSPYSADFTQYGRRIGDELATLLAACIEDMHGNQVGEIDIRASFKVKMTYALHTTVPRSPYPNYHFYNAQGQCVFITSGGHDGHACGTAIGTYEAACIVPGYLLNNDTYFIGLALTFTHSGIHVSFYEREALSVVIRDPIDETLEEMRHGYSGVIPGAVRPKLEWEVRRIS